MTATVQTTTGGNWLTASISNNQTPAVVTLSAAGTGLAPGVYNGTLTLTSLGAGNSPVVIPVTLTVSTQPQLLVNPPTLNFSYQLLERISAAAKIRGDFDGGSSDGACFGGGEHFVWGQLAND